MKAANQQGVTLIELLIVMFLSLIALMAASTPFVGERSFWGTGTRQAEAQRSAQVALRAIARVAREGSSVDTPIPANQITFNTPCGKRTFQTAGNGNNQFQMVDNCVLPALTVTLIDGVKSKVIQFTPTLINAKLVDIQLQVKQENQQSEQLQTQLYLRN